MTKARDGGTVIVWIAVSTCTVKDTPIYQFQAANDPSQPLDMLEEPQQNKIFTEVYEKIKKIVAAA